MSAELTARITDELLIFESPRAASEFAKRIRPTAILR
jgi:hypothetical protein